MNKQIPVAVWVQRFRKADVPLMVREGNLMRQCTQSAVVCATSPSRILKMKMTTNALGFELLNKLERLHRHGFTIVEVPEYWTYESSRPQRWCDELTNLAVDRVMDLPDPPELNQRAPYDEALAQEVLTVVEREYPHRVSIIAVKQALAVEPSDNALLTALEALSHENKIEGGEHLGSTRRLPINVEIRPTPLGRDEVKGTRRNIPHMSVIHGDQNINYGNAGAIGRQSVGTINQQQQWAAIANDVDLPQVVIELQTLKAELIKTAKAPGDFKQLRLIAEAEECAEQKDGPKVMEILSNTGRGLFEFAKEMGTDITAKLISKAIGLDP